MAQLAITRQQFQTIAWLRWRIFVNGLRGKGAAGELVVRVLSYPLVGLMVIGPAVAAGAASWYLVNRGMDNYLAIPLWIIFALWQFIGVSTSTSGPSFDLSTLARFPLRYRDYLLIRLAFGLLDIPTLSGTACLLAMAIGISIAAPILAPWAMLTLLVYALVNILFSRMAYTWFERWMAQRRTRELITGLILVLSLAIQFGSQFLQRLNLTHRHHRPISPLMQSATHVLLMLNGLLPPGLAANSIAHAHSNLYPVATLTLAGMSIFGAAFLLILHLRLHAIYLGEDLSEAPASNPAKAKLTTRTLAKTYSPATVTSHATSLLSPTISACLTREFRYLLRSGPKLYVLIMPVFMIILFSFRMAGLDSFGSFASFGSAHSSRAYLFTYGCAYTELLLVSMLYNSLGGDGSGIQFYFLAPLRFRDVMIAKNLLVALVLVLELILMYIVSAIVAAPASADITAATLAWVLLTTLINMSIGNVRSILSPRIVEVSRVRRQNVSGLNSLISLLVVAACVALGGLIQFLCTYLNFTIWAAAAIFTALSAVAAVMYLSTLNQLDSTASQHREFIITQLSKT